MTTQLKLPELGEQVSSGIVLAVLVSVGDHVESDQPLLELETDKATTEVPAERSGTITEILVSQGDEVSGGDAIFSLEEDDEEQEAVGADSEPDAAREEEATEDQPQKDEAADEQETERGEQARPSSGESPERDAESKREREHQPEPGKGDAEGSDRRQQRAPRIDAPAPASPEIRRLARKLGVDPTAVAGTGDGGRVTEDDLFDHVREIVATVQDRAEDHVELPDFSRWGDVRREPMNAVRRATARNVSTAWEQIPHVTQYDEADITGLQSFRERFREEAEEKGGRLTITAILVKIAASALKTFPRFNASVDLDSGEYVLKDFVNVAVAVDTDDGLLTPVIRGADEKGLLEISAELTELASQARNRSLSSEEMRGGTFSITNLGGLGTTHFTPIIAWPQVSILSVSRALMRPVWNGDEFQPSRILPLGITYDHRAVDGADAARFLRWIVEVLEDPLRMTIHR